MVTVSAGPQFPAILSKIPQGTLLQLVVKSDFYPSSVTSFPTISTAKPLFNSHFRFIYTFSCSSLLPPPPSSPQQPKPSSSRLTLCPCSTYLVPPAAFGGTPFPIKERRGRFPGISFHHTGKQLLNGNKSDRTL